MAAAGVMLPHKCTYKHRHNIKHTHTHSRTCTRTRTHTHTHTHTHTLSRCHTEARPAKKLKSCPVTHTYHDGNRNNKGLYLVLLYLYFVIILLFCCPTSSMMFATHLAIQTGLFWNCKLESFTTLALPLLCSFDVGGDWAFKASR